MLACDIEEARQRIQRQIDEGSGLDRIPLRLEDKPRITKWQKYTADLLRHLFTTDKFADDFILASSVVSNGVEELTSIQQRLEFYVPDSQRVSSSAVLPIAESALPSRKVFVVHGHDNDVKNEVARFLQKLDLEPVILHEQADGGRTVIEKFEDHSDTVGFAVILLTADDEGKSRGAGELELRARQNVIAELGYFVGKLKRKQICVLKDPGVSVPSDFHGVLYTDLAGDWKLKLAGEISNAGIKVDLNRVI